MNILAKATLLTFVFAASLGAEHPKIRFDPKPIEAFGVVHLGHEYDISIGHFGAKRPSLDCQSPDDRMSSFYSTPTAFSTITLRRVDGTPIPCADEDALMELAVRACEQVSVVGDVGRAVISWDSDGSVMVTELCAVMRGF